MAENLDGDLEGFLNRIGGGRVSGELFQKICDVARSDNYREQLRAICESYGGTPFYKDVAGKARTIILLKEAVKRRRKS